jgi:uncharacterized protein (DUF1810 family)
MEKQDTFDLNRFVKAQNGVYDRVLMEIRQAKKHTRWMWFIFPQITGLGKSARSQKYAIKSLNEASKYLNQPTLGERLVECVEILVGIEGKTAHEIFGSPDDLKLRSSMTLFAGVASPGSVFDQVI